MRLMQTALALAALAFGIVPGLRQASAQVQGLPVYNSGVATGIALYGDVGFANTNGVAKGTALAVTGRAGFGPLGATAILSNFNPDGPGGSYVSVGATLDYKFFGGPLIPLSATLQAGIGYAKPKGVLLPNNEVKDVRFPIGVGVALTIPNPALAIKPWIAPRLDISRLSVGGATTTSTNFGLGAGLELNLLNGFGLQAAYDHVFADGGDPGVFGVGAHFAFQVPGL
jgi:hypothetical protein